MVDVSIIIVNWNTKDIVKICLQSVYEQTKKIIFEVIVIDNASADGSAEMIKAEFPQVILIENSQNRGFAAANNQGIKIAKGRYMLLLNPDTVVLDGAIQKSIAFAERHPDAAVVGIRNDRPDGSLTKNCFQFASVQNLMISAFGMNQLFPNSRLWGRERYSWWDYQSVREVDVVAGCYMLVRRSAVDQVGNLDESYFMYGEEMDWCCRFQNSGWKILYFPDARIIHYGGLSAAQNPVEMSLEFQKSLLRFIKKRQGWSGYFAANELLVITGLIRMCYWSLRWAIGPGHVRSLCRKKLRQALASSLGRKAVMWMRRFHRVIKEHGVCGGLVYLAHRFSPIHISLVFKMNPPISTVVIPQLTIIRYSRLIDIGPERLQTLAEARGMRFIREFERLFRIGAQLWMGLLDGEVAGICWSRSGLTRPDYFVPLETNDANILSCFVFPQFRGRGIYPTMLKYIASTLKDHSGIRRVFIDCQPWNHSSIRGIEKAGFHLIGRAFQMDLFSRVVFRYPRHIIEGSLGRRGQTAMVSVYGKRGIIVRLIYLIFAACWYTLTVGDRLCRCPLIVLCYHGIQRGMRDEFSWQMQKLSKWKSATSHADSESHKGNNSGVLVTFDDAFANLLDSALPVLEHYQIPVTIFVVADNLGCMPRWEMLCGHPESTEMTMTAEQLVEVSKNPLIHVGSHTLTHPDLTRIQPDKLKKELTESKHRLEELLHKPIEDLALPFGSYNQEVLCMARKAGYKKIYTVDPKPVNRMSKYPVKGRFYMSPDVWRIEFLLTCAGAYAWLYQWRRLFHRISTIVCSTGKRRYHEHG
jgi:GT2 family glycosyltransferase/peptidoglycan/xylan/chitin deacetylase (PgdA/CDA1 family)/RimJ/RimL family protein N-acetyltransferase